MSRNGDTVQRKSRGKTTKSSELKPKNSDLHASLANFILADQEQDKSINLSNPSTDHFIPAPDQSRQFRPMLQGTGTNRLTQLSTRKNNPNVDAITGLATISKDGMNVFIREYDKLAGGLRVSTHKLLDACAIVLTAQNHYRGNGEPNSLVSISLDSYMQQCGVPMTKASKDKVRRKVREDLEMLYNISLEWSESDGRQSRNYEKMRLISSQGIKNGRIMVRFSPEIAQYLTNSYIMQYPIALFQIDERIPSAYYIGKKLHLHHSINNNRVKGTANIISVRALLECCPDIPSHEEVMNSGRQLEQRIIAPFENALNALSDIIRWEYCNQKNAPLNKRMLQNFQYCDFIESFIYFDILDTPHAETGVSSKAASPQKTARSRAAKTKKTPGKN